MDDSIGNVESIAANGIEMSTLDARTPLKKLARRSLSTTNSPLTRLDSNIKKTPFHHQTSTSNKKDLANCNNEDSNHGNDENANNRNSLNRFSSDGPRSAIKSARKGTPSMSAAKERNSLRMSALRHSQSLPDGVASISSSRSPSLRLSNAVALSTKNSPSISVIRKSLPRCSGVNMLTLDETLRQNREWAMFKVDSDTINNAWDVFERKYGEEYVKTISRESINLIRRVGSCAKYRAAHWLQLSKCADESNLSVAETFKKGCRGIPPTQLKEVIEQIKLDVPRTIPNHPYFQENLGRSSRNGRLQLERVLVAFVFLHPETNYLQGMNFIAAFLLIVFDLDEDLALTVLSDIIQNRLPGYFEDFTALQRDTALLKHYLCIEDPELSEHLLQEDMDFDIATVTPSWLLTLYFNVFPPKMAARIWDGLLCIPHQRSSGYLIRVGLSIFRVLRSDLLAASSLGDVYQVLQDLPIRFGKQSECDALLQDLLLHENYALPEEDLERVSTMLLQSKPANTTETERKWGPMKIGKKIGEKFSLMSAFSSSSSNSSSAAGAIQHQQSSDGNKMGSLNRFKSAMHRFLHQHDYADF